ncbi:baseplate J/gp47 family protein [Pasteurella skyensis]|uniref:Baseplate J/gp47 family protein n=1 Tax=Phocoenobacter skyensis TaxID=97481 RepID=A0AAJ6N9D2_9PAST|nr:baseplate J/gp47 family protein [Pasteurella skyensis]MDP8162795.1 baseplate J/gp47 family protein [Pasteurella skyensis]MDP8172618.1 baseplate J/gp47 family protein [Pasteurella skyensis]MDP8179118.1 baseplate J/gp47 family protein [Pasteurella skyensis]MDP8183197.1 baseplate J/gp47 family protein [Pasteurella skyensis]MDP8189248.1 baseplate J/gp47 family protein [Pasteurella skyensis]
MTNKTRNEIKIVDDDIKLILSESVSDYEQRTGKILQPAHIERSIIQTYSYREYLVKKGINEAFLQTFPQFAVGIALDLCGEPMGCYRLKDKPARTILRFSIEDEHNSIIIPAGTQVAVTDELYFETINDDVITPLISYVEIEAKANVTGNAGNGWEVGQIKQLKTPLETDLKITVSNIDKSSGGLAEESDDDYRKRILLAPEAFSSCGSIEAYKYHTFSVSQAIADVDIDTPRGGLVKITVLTKSGKPDSRLLSDIQSYVSAERLRPLCDTVEVANPIITPYQINAELILLEGYREDIVKTQARNALQLYLSDKTKKLGLDVVPSALISALRVEGVYDVILHSPNKLTIPKDGWAKCTAISVEVNGERSNG